MTLRDRMTLRHRMTFRRRRDRHGQES